MKIDISALPLTWLALQLLRPQIGVYGEVILDQAIQKVMLTQRTYKSLAYAAPDGIGL